MIMSKEPEKWEVWFANVRYEDNPTIVKKRPVIIYDKQHAFIISLKVTGQMPRNNKTEYVLQRWSEAGLDTVSTVRLSKQLKILRSDYIHKIGNLRTKDIMGIKVKIMGMQ